MLRTGFAFLMVGLTALGTVVAHAATGPTVHIASFSQLPAPLPYPYDAVPNAAARVAASEAEAAADGKLLLIDLGGNWCPDCRILGVMRLPEVKAFIDSRYEVVTVDVGRMNENLDIPKHYGITERLRGVPSILIVDPKSHKVLNEGHIAALADARTMTPQAVSDWLARWTP